MTVTCRAHEFRCCSQTTGVVRGISFPAARAEWKTLPAIESMSVWGVVDLGRRTRKLVAKPNSPSGWKTSASNFSLISPPPAVIETSRRASRCQTAHPSIASSKIFTLANVRCPCLLQDMRSGSHRPQIKILLNDGQSSSKLLRATRPGEHPTIGAYIVGGNVKRPSNIGNRCRLVSEIVAGLTAKHVGVWFRCRQNSTATICEPECGCKTPFNESSGGEKFK